MSSGHKGFQLVQNFIPVFTFCCFWMATWLQTTENYSENKANQTLNMLQFAKTWAWGSNLNNSLNLNKGRNRDSPNSDYGLLLTDLQEGGDCRPHLTVKMKRGLKKKPGRKPRPSEASFQKTKAVPLAVLALPRATPTSRVSRARCGLGRRAWHLCLPLAEAGTSIVSLERTQA